MPATRPASSSTVRSPNWGGMRRVQWAELSVKPGAAGDIALLSLRLIVLQQQALGPYDGSQASLSSGAGHAEHAAAGQDTAALLQHCCISGRPSWAWKRSKKHFNLD